MAYLLSVYILLQQAGDVCKARLSVLTFHEYQSIILKKGGTYESLLCEVPRLQRNERPQGHHHEEQETRYPGYMPNLRDEDVQDRQSREIVSDSRGRHYQ